MSPSGKVDEYRRKLQTLRAWDAYLLEESGLPGPRGNLELAQAVAELGDESLFQRYLTIPIPEAPENSAPVFLVFCGVVGLGKLIAQGKQDHVQTLRRFASDARWRVREAVAIALQKAGDGDIEFVLNVAQAWERGNLLERRAVVAALCEPRLLKDPAVAGRVLQVLDRITASILEVENRKDEALAVLKKGLGYGWSVAVAASPAAGKRYMEKWISSPDRDIQWIMKENLTKNRLVKLDADWVTRQSKKLRAQTSKGFQP
jgi:hypothetical protein